MMPVGDVKWLIPWEPSLTLVLIFMITAFAYVRGCMRLQIPMSQKTGFWLGLICLYAMLHTRFDYYSEHEFFMHRIQHSVLHHLGPFLIALSRPGRCLAAGLPSRLKPLGQKLLASTPIQFLAAVCNQPIMAVTLFCGLIIFWLLANVHFIAMLDWRLYRVMNWTMVLNGMMFWNLVLNNYALRQECLSAGARIAMMLGIIPPQIVVGMLLFLAPHELYPIYTICGRAFALSPLADQQLGGLILWIPAAMMSVIGIVVVLQREWLGKRV